MAHAGTTGATAQRWHPALSVHLRRQSNIDMNRCLQIKEVAREVCLHLARWEMTTPDDLGASAEEKKWQIRGQADLFAMACTCTAFVEPALDALWRVQPDGIQRFVELVTKVKAEWNMVSLIASHNG